jgi:hypothetical protein
MIVTLGKPRGLLLPVENPFLNFKIDRLTAILRVKEKSVKKKGKKSKEWESSRKHNSRQ